MSTSSRQTVRRAEAGQAIVELTIALFALMFVAIGIIFVGGAGLTSIKVLLATRESAESAASLENTGQSNGSDIRDWSYTAVNYKRGHSRQDTSTIRIPFLSEDDPSSSAAGISTSYFSELEPSRENEPRNFSYRLPGGTVFGKSYYAYHDLSSYNSLTLPDNLESSSSFAVSNLVFASGTLPADLWRSGEEIYTLRTFKDARLLKDRIHQAGWFDLRAIAPSKWRSNTVAYPAFAPVK